MENLIKVNGLVEWNMVKDNGLELMEVNIMENGDLEKLKDMEFILHLMEIFIKENLKII